MTVIDNFKSMLRHVRGNLGAAKATPETDPTHYFSKLWAMPNPDPILREMGMAERTYFAIMMDPHVLGDMRSIRGNFRGHSYRLVAGDEGDAKSAAALALCQEWMERVQPNRLADWMEVMWQMACAAFTGYRAHELVWSVQNGKYLPEQVIDRPNRRFRFDVYGTPRLVSIGNLMGEPVEDWQFIISRHWADHNNPYGVAVLSSLFWTWTFKTGGWRYFVKYCERHGLPWPIGRYPQGTSDEDQDKLAEGLASMIEDSYLVTQEGNAVELLTPSGSGAGGVPQHNLIDLCNREMSKALTGQAMVAELNGAGARAASETALKRQESIDDSVRDIATGSMGTIFRWITLLNFGDGVAPPTLEFYRHENAGKDRAEVYELACSMGAKPSKKALLDELGIPEAETPDDELQAGGALGTDQGLDPTTGQPVETKPLAPTSQAKPAASTTKPNTMPTADKSQARLHLATISGFEFAKAAGMMEDEAVQLAAEAADSAIEDHMIAPVALMLQRYEEQGKTLAQFQADLEVIVGNMDQDALREVLERSMRYAIVRGAATNTA